MKCPDCGGEMKLETATSADGRTMQPVWTCDPCPGIGFGRYQKIAGDRVSLDDDQPRK